MDDKDFINEMSVLVADFVEKDPAKARKVAALILGGLAIEIGLTDPVFFFKKVVNDARKDYRKFGYNPYDCGMIRNEDEEINNKLKANYGGQENDAPQTIVKEGLYVGSI